MQSRNYNNFKTRIRTITARRRNLTKQEEKLSGYGKDLKRYNNMNVEIAKVNQA